MSSNQVYLWGHQNAILADTKKTISDAMKLMSQFNIRHLPVIDDNLKLSGILTATDITNLMYKTGNFSFLEIPIKEVMTDFVITSYPSTSLVDAILMMNFSEISGIPIVEHKDIMGMFTIRDALGIDMLWKTLDKVDLSPIDDLGDITLIQNPVTENHSLWQVLDKMQELKRRYVCVIDDKGNIVKSVTLLMIFDQITSVQYHYRSDFKYLHETRVGDLYTDIPLTIEFPEKIGVIRKRILESSHEIALLKSHGVYKKTVSEFDLFKYLAAYLHSDYFKSLQK